MLTSFGYPACKGQLLQFGKAIGDKGRFRYGNIKNQFPSATPQDNQVGATKLKGFGISVLGNGYFSIIGTFTVNNTEKSEIEIYLAFDHAIYHVPAIPGKLLVPGDDVLCILQEKTQSLTTLLLQRDKLPSKNVQHETKKLLAVMALFIYATASAQGGRKLSKYLTVNITSKIDTVSAFSIDKTTPKRAGGASFTGLHKSIYFRRPTGC